MRIATIRLEWFRGAASGIELPAKGKSIAVYGANGAGKSSFVDGLEYLLCDGKIGHLSHEYSGKKQEKGVINTHKPTLQPTSVSVEFTDGKKVTAVVQSNGAFTLGGDGVGYLNGLDYRRLVLRQDEVAAFIRSAKGEKYSALLPLLGLEQLENAAEAVRQLTKRVDRTAGLMAKQALLKALEAKEAGRYQAADGVEAAIAKVHSKYRPGEARETNLKDDCRVLQSRIQDRLEAFTPDVQRFEALKRVADKNLDQASDEVKDKREKLAGASIKLLRERLDVVEKAEAWLAKSGTAVEACPACGQKVGQAELRAHLDGEKKVLKKERALLDEFKAAAERFRQCVSEISREANGGIAKQWLEAQAESGAGHLKSVADVAGLSADSMAEPTIVKVVDDSGKWIVGMAREGTKQAPPATRELLEDFRAVESGEAFLDMAPLLRGIRAIQQATGHLEVVERSIRQAIREQADAAIADISKDVQRMWAILHPGKEIEDINLKHPDDTDKAIDIELKFFGVGLKSPRLTLSEGNRNSLGLCVFLSMALRAAGDQPVVLDDVVVSLDREHRGMVATLLEKEFSGRQVILLTHDRDWFAELRYFQEKGWQHLSLQPYTGPQDGIAWTKAGAGFADARAQLKVAPDVAGNTARKIMDTELALIADRLHVPMEYRQGLKNDHRMAHDFFEALRKAAGVAFQRRNENGDYVKSDDLGKVLGEADTLVVAWGNKASHTFDVTPGEAEKLIDKCEEALNAFICGGCGKSVAKLEDGGAEGKQCGCGAIRWRYGKL